MVRSAWWGRINRIKILQKQYHSVKKEAEFGYELGFFYKDYIILKKSVPFIYGVFLLALRTINEANKSQSTRFSKTGAAFLPIKR